IKRGRLSSYLLDRLLEPESLQLWPQAVRHLLEVLLDPVTQPLWLAARLNDAPNRQLQGLSEALDKGCGSFPANKSYFAGVVFKFASKRIEKWIPVCDFKLTGSQVNRERISRFDLAGGFFDGTGNFGHQPLDLWHCLGVATPAVNLNGCNSAGVARIGHVVFVDIGHLAVGSTRRCGQVMIYS